MSGWRAWVYPGSSLRAPRPSAEGTRIPLIAHGLKGRPATTTAARYDLKLWIGHLFEGATYLPS